jgi:hypothetical protein
MDVKKAYYYFFYKIYQVTLTGAIKSLSKFYASLIIMALEFAFLLSLFVYYKIFIDRYAALEVKSFKTLVFAIPIFLLDYFYFIRTDKWKDYIAEFDLWSKRKKRLGSIIVSSIILLIIINLIFSFYLMSRIDWRPYR